MKCIWTNVVIPKNLTQTGRKKHDTVRFSSRSKKKERGEKVELSF